MPGQGRRPVLEQADEHVGERRLTTGPDAPPSGGGSAVGLPISEEVARSSGRFTRFSPFRVVILVVLVVAAVVAWELTRGSAPAYRTVAVGTGTAVQTLDAVATITPVNQANLNFNVSGTVSAVNVSVGQQVTAGQTLASLDVTSLQAGVTSAQANLASAQATLVSDEATQSAQSSATTSSPTTSGATGSTPASEQSSNSAGRPSGSATTTTTTPASSGQPTKPSQQITALQQNLATDQHQEDLDASRATAALGQATTACESNAAAPSGSAGSSGSTGSRGSTATTTTTTAATATTCAAALSQASAAQAAVSTDIKKVDKDESALTSALESSSGSGAPSGTGSGFPGKTGTTKGTTTGTTTATTTATTTPAKTSSAGTGSSSSQKDAASATTGGGSSSTASGGSGSQTKKVVTSQQLAVDQAAIDTAQANLSAAQQALDDVNLVSTIAGTVASVSIAPADTVTAGGSSGDAAIVVIGSGSSYDVTTDVAVADVGKIAVGQQALVTPDATSSVVNGSVSAIGAVASSGTSVTYPVTIAIDAPDLGGLSGSQANVSIVVKRSVNVTTVPTSAVHTIGTIHYVTVIDKNTPKTVRVGLGTVGDTLTQVTSGVTKGELVSLADLAEPVPSSSTNTTTGRFGGALGGAGGFGGGAGGFGGGSFAGGGRFSALGG